MGIHNLNVEEHDTETKRNETEFVLSNCTESNVASHQEANLQSLAGPGQRAV
jgi:hypothetical protein